LDGPERLDGVADDDVGTDALGSDLVPILA
jgi:hypothetical protein